MNIWIEAGLCLVALAVLLILGTSLTRYKATAGETLFFLIIFAAGVALVGIGEAAARPNCTTVYNRCVDLKPPLELRDFTAWPATHQQSPHLSPRS